MNKRNILNNNDIDTKINDVINNINIFNNIDLDYDSKSIYIEIYKILYNNIDIIKKFIDIYDDIKNNVLILENKINNINKDNVMKDMVNIIDIKHKIININSKMILNKMIFIEYKYKLNKMNKQLIEYYLIYYKLLNDIKIINKNNKIINDMNECKNSLDNKILNIKEQFNDFKNVIKGIIMKIDIFQKKIKDNNNNDKYYYKDINITNNILKCKDNKNNEFINDYKITKKNIINLLEIIKYYNINKIEDDISIIINKYEQINGVEITIQFDLNGRYL